MSAEIFGGVLALLVLAVVIGQRVRELRDESHHDRARARASALLDRMRAQHDDWSTPSHNTTGAQ